MAIGKDEIRFDSLNFVDVCDRCKEIKTIACSGTASHLGKPELVVFCGECMVQVLEQTGDLETVRRAVAEHDQQIGDIT